MKPTRLALALESFLKEFLPGQRNMSRHTIKNYGYAFVLLYEYFQKKRHVPPERLELDDLTPEAVLKFLDWLETERGNSIASRNQRLAALHSFFRHAQGLHPERAAQYQRILCLSSKRSTVRLSVNHLPAADMKKLLASPDLRNPSGRRDAALISLLYDAGLRVGELCSLTPTGLRLDPPFHAAVEGKGRKRRVVPLLPATVNLLLAYMQDCGLRDPGRGDNPLFFNRQGRPLTRAGVRYILRKYAAQLPDVDPKIRISPHCCRHSKAMHLLQAGNPLVVIQSILGHTDIRSTTVYARADLEMMRRAVEKSDPLTPTANKKRSWQKAEVMEWLRRL